MNSSTLRYNSIGILMSVAVLLIMSQRLMKAIDANMYGMAPGAVLLYSLMCIFCGLLAVFLTSQRPDEDPFRMWIGQLIDLARRLA